MITFELLPQILELNGKADASIFRHGQHKGVRIRGTFGNSNKMDDHHSPIRPKQYISMRLKIQLQFYQRRLPRYFRTRVLCESVLVLGGLAGTIFALINLIEWAPIAAAITSAITAWLEFQRVTKKLQRYSDVICKLDDVVLWWDSLTPVEQANLENIHHLVRMCEDMFQVERSAWLSTSIVTKMIAKDASTVTPKGEDIDV